MSKSWLDEFNQNLQDLNETRVYAKMQALSMQADEESAAERAAAAPVTFEYNDIWKFPKVENNLVYHTSWGGEDITESVHKVLYVLYRFNLSCDIADAKQGPTVSRLYLTPTGHTKVRSVVSLENDFKVELNNSNVSVYVDNGYLVVEIPRKERETVYFGDLVNSDAFRSADNTALAIGMDIERNPIIFDLKKAVHMLIAGQTGSGKSVFMHTLVLSMLMKNTPYSLHMHIIDPKVLEFSRYKNHPLCTVTTEVQDAIKLLDNMCKEMDRRYQILAQSGSRDIDSYNESHADLPMRREVIIIDELADLMKQAGTTVENYIVRLAQKARACGIHLIIATQYPVRTVVTGLIKQNTPTRICLSVKDSVASRVALDQTGAENLLGNGDMLFLANGALNPVRLQGGFVTENEIGNIIDEVCQNIKSVHREVVKPSGRTKEEVVALAPRTINEFANIKPCKPVKVRQQKVFVLGAASIMCGCVGLFLWMLFIPALTGVILGLAGIRDNMESKPVAIVGTCISGFALALPFLVINGAINIFSFL